jgi:DNA-directed RNA polymerase subunit RPC12/RpoP
VEPGCTLRRPEKTAGWKVIGTSLNDRYNALLLRAAGQQVPTASTARAAVPSARPGTRRPGRLPRNVRTDKPVSQGQPEIVLRSHFMIAFLCTGCGKGLKMPDEFAGKRARCPYCGQQVPIPGAAPVVPVAPVSPGAAPPAPLHPPAAPQVRPTPPPAGGPPAERCRRQPRHLAGVRGRAGRHQPRRADGLGRGGARTQLTPHPHVSGRGLAHPGPHPHVFGLCNPRPAWQVGGLLLSLGPTRLGCSFDYPGAARAARLVGRDWRYRGGSSSRIPELIS